jgi:hypothetical protein
MNLNTVRFLLVAALALLFYFGISEQHQKDVIAGYESGQFLPGTPIPGQNAYKSGETEVMQRMYIFQTQDGFLYQSVPDENPDSAYLADVLIKLRTQHPCANFIGRDYGVEFIGDPKPHGNGGVMKYTRRPGVSIWVVPPPKDFVCIKDST